MEKRNHHARIERRLAEPTHIAAHDRLEIQALPHQPNDKPRDVVLGHEVPHIRRQKQRLIDIPGAKVLAHSPSLNQTRWHLNSDYLDRLLGAQFPIPRLRIVYAKAGTLPAACLVRDRAIIDHMLYWASSHSEFEGYYLTAILNSETSRSRVAEMQARGQFGARHFDKVMFTMPIPRFDTAVALHNELAAAAAEAERIAAAFELPETVKFQRARKLIRDALTETGLSPHIDGLVARLLDQSIEERGDDE